MVTASWAVPVPSYGLHGGAPEGILPVRDRTVPGPVTVVIQVPGAVNVCAYLCSPNAVPVPGYGLHDGTSEGILSVCDRTVPGAVTVVIQIPGAVKVTAYLVAGILDVETSYFRPRTADPGTCA